jgi:hypothetical protein
VRQAFAHEVTLTMPPTADTRAPGGAITMALCGHWEHEPPCPLAPHHTTATRTGSEVHVRVLFATEPAHEAAVRDRITAALSAGHLDGPDGIATQWKLLHSAESPVSANEVDHADRLIST